MAFQTPFLFRGYKTDWLYIFLLFIMILVKNYTSWLFKFSKTIALERSRMLWNEMAFETPLAPRELIYDS